MKADDPGGMPCWLRISRMVAFQRSLEQRGRVTEIGLGQLFDGSGKVNESTIRGLNEHTEQPGHPQASFRGVAACGFLI